MANAHGEFRNCDLRLGHADIIAIGPEDGRAVRTLTECLREPEPRARAAAADVLAAFRTDTKAVVPELAQLPDNRDADVRVSAAGDSGEK